MKILIACEESQEVCRAFRALGHEAYSCDLQDCSGGHPEWHIKGDVVDLLYSEYFDLVIAHPPCTYITITANRWLKEQPQQKSGVLVGAARLEAQKEAIKFVELIWDAPIERICIENPVGVLSTKSKLGKPSQVIQPYYFGDPYEKLTHLWLKNLPKLIHIREPDLFSDTITHTQPEPRLSWVTKDGRVKSQPTWYAMASQKNGERGKIRSKTFPAVANAMAQQWGSLSTNTPCNPSNNANNPFHTPL